MAGGNLACQIGDEMASSGGRAKPPLGYLLEPRKGSTGAWMRHRIGVGTLLIEESETEMQGNQRFPGS